MTDPEDPAAKNEQELNLFSDQPVPGDMSAGQGSSGVSGGLPAEDMPAQVSPAEASAEEAVPPVSAGPTGPDVPADDSPVVAPPPPSRKPSSPSRPGIVSPRAGRTAFPPASSAASASSGKTHKPLPDALQPSQQTLGQMLTAIRSARGMSVEEVAIFTRIRTEYILELESGELLEKLPTVYVSAYVRKLIEVYDLSKEDSCILLEKLREETPQEAEELPDKLLESVNEGALVNEGENKRIRNITIIVFVVIGLIAAALIWLIVLVAVKYLRTSDPVPGRDPSAVTSGAVQPAEEPVSQTVHLDESELDALIVPETPSISVLKMSKVPGVRESL